MPKADVLLIESGRANAPSFAPALERKGYEVQVHHKIEQAVSSAKKKTPDLLVLDAASMKTPDPGSGANLTLVHPFTPRKLLNRVERMLPGDVQYTLEAGPIKLNIAKGRVRCMKKETRLTPKLTKLLEVFLRNPGRLMMRKTLIRKVWHTDYTGDTRTLDVHMSWLRKAIEANPACPKYFKTIRGMGYRLDLPQEK
jgi:DNA-binding response OmpR family regulator